MNSIWTKETNPIPVKQVSEQINVDVVIIGGGLAGLLSAHYLKNSGLTTIVLEKDHIGHGVTGNTTGKITSQHGLFYAPLYEKGKKEAARQYACLQEKALKEYAHLINKERISCDFERMDSYLYTIGNEEKIKNEALAAKAVGINADFVKKTSLPFETHGAVCFHNQAQFHPLKFLHHIAKDLNIYQESPVTAIKGHLVSVYNHTLDKTITIFGKQIIVASHFPIINFPGMYFAKMYQDTSYILALKNAIPVDGMFKDEAENGYSLRNYKDLLLFGGGTHRSGVIPDHNPVDDLRQAAKRYFPNSVEVTSWSAGDCMPLRKVPFIGPYTRLNDYTYVATGYQKWGMTNAMVSALLLSRNILDSQANQKNIFHPANLHIKPKITEVLKHTSITASNLLIPTKAPRCTHLGCRLHWNPFEQTYDCPCHGSKFTKKGEILTNPTKKPLKKF